MSRTDLLVDEEGLIGVPYVKFRVFVQMVSHGDMNVDNVTCINMLRRAPDLDVVVDVVKGGGGEYLRGSELDGARLCVKLAESRQIVSEVDRKKKGRLVVETRCTFGAGSKWPFMWSGSHRTRQL